MSNNIVGEGRLGIAWSPPEFYSSREEYKCCPSCAYLTHWPSCIAPKEKLDKYFREYGRFRINKGKLGEGCPLFQKERPLALKVRVKDKGCCSGMVGYYIKGDRPHVAYRKGKCRKGHRAFELPDKSPEAYFIVLPVQEIEARND